MPDAASLDGPTVLLPGDAPTPPVACDPFADGFLPGSAAPAPPGAGGDDPPEYGLVELVGEGGMGRVYRARDRALGRDVAVKLLKDEHRHDPAAVGRFLRESQVTGRLQHPGIPAVYRVGATPSGRPYLAMKLVRGETLEALLKRKAPLDPLSVFEGVCQALAYAHACGVIHRDLKPANIMVGSFGEVKVMDWGLAKILADADAGGDSALSGVAEPALAGATDSAPGDADSATRAGSVLGTPAYMPPEQASGDSGRVSRRSDVFGLGALLCVLLTGEPPFGSGGALSVCLAASRGDMGPALARLDASGADPGVVALCKRCLAPDPDDRPADAGEVAAAAAALRRGSEERARRAELDAAAAAARAGEQAKRRRVVAASAAAVALVLAVGASAALAGLLEARAARREAELALAGETVHRADADAARLDADARRVEAEDAGRVAAREKRDAQQSAAESDALAKFFGERVLAAARPKGYDGGLGRDVTLRAAIDASLSALEADFAGRPAVESRLRSVLGTTYSFAGDPAAALVQRERAAELARAHHGPEHPATLARLHNLALSYDEVGRTAEALELRERVLEAKRRVLRPGDPATLATESDLADSYAAAGRHAEALRLREAVYAAQKRVLSADHAARFRGAASLADSYAAAGRHAEALRLRERNLADRTRVCGPDYPETLASLADLAASCAEFGRHAEAVALREECLARRGRVLRRDHPDTLAARVRLGVALRRQGREADALPVLRAGFAEGLAALPPTSHHLCLGACELAECCLALGRPDEAAAVAESYVAHVGVGGDPWRAGLVLGALARHRAAGGDSAGCRAACERYERLELRGHTSLYNAACLRAVAGDAAAALAWLAKSAVAGYADARHTRADPDLALLRGNPEFEALLDALPREPAPAPRVAR